MTAQARELEALFAALLDDELNAAEAARLNELLESRPDVLHAYIDLQQMHTALAWRYHAAAEAAPLPAEAAAPRPVAPAGFLRGQATRVWGQLLATQQWLSRPAYFGLFFASVTLASLLLFFAQVQFQTLADRPHAAALDSGAHSSAPAAARLLGSQAALWSGAEPRDDESLPWRRPLHLRKGWAEVELPHGVRVVVEGPAEFSLARPNLLQLTRGKLAVTVERAAGRNFTVRTPLAEVVDLGTSFGVVADEQRTEVQVFAGHVSVRPWESEAPEMLTAGQTAEIAPRGVLRRGVRDDDSRRFVLQLPPAPAYADLVAQAKPRAWWRMEQFLPSPLPRDGVAAVDSGESGAEGRYFGEVRDAPSLPSLGRALQLSSPGGGLVVDSREAWPEYKALSVEGWLKIDATPTNYARIVERSYRQGFVLAVNAQNSRQLRLTPGHLLWGVNAVFAESSRPVADGRWHHVAGVWDGETVRAYVDGVGGAAVPCAGPIGASSAPLLIGASSVRPPTEPVLGLVDEVAIYDRPLAAEEIVERYQAGAGLPPASPTTTVAPPSSSAIDEDDAT